MSDLSMELTAPNGRKYTQPTGLFINNEWVKSSNGQKLTSINPTHATLPFQAPQIANNLQR
jgi:aldehyde dehydrogenase (NAD(P)+)